MLGRSFAETTVLSFLIFGFIAMLFIFCQRTEAESLCGNCHDAKNGTDFPVDHVAVGVPGSDVFLLIKEIISDSRNSPFLDATHLNNGVTCGNCHDRTFEMFAEVSSDTCFNCHGDYQELGVLTENEELEDMNPHRSHLGEVDCSVCHHAHEKSVPYCLQCHFEFTMGIPAG